jgi:hypothetical protein
MERTKDYPGVSRIAYVQLREGGIHVELYSSGRIDTEHNLHGSKEDIIGQLNGLLKKRDYKVIFKGPETDTSREYHEVCLALCAN